MLRDFRDRPSRVQTAPQQYSVTSSWSGRLNSSAVLNERSTYSAPRTSLPYAETLLAQFFVHGSSAKVNARTTRAPG